ncbi:MAG: hypothetical protein II678_09335, partial [Erysipelotrichaceae bacterium]|nr:hypothetical protein [Erysipelotrichaceae bacterium]
VKSLLNTGFNENYTNRLFTFDRTGWGRGAGRMAQVSFDTQRNFTSGKTPFQIIQSMPFCLFHISPITLLTKDQWTELQRQSVILANVLHQAALPDDVIRRVTNLVTTENFDELKDTCAEFLAQMQEEDNQYHLTDEQISVIYNYVALLNEYAEVMRGYPIESYNDYVLTTDTTPKSKKAYFIRLNSPNDEAEAIYMQTTFGTNSVEKTKFRNLCNAHLIYERKSETMQLTTNEVNRCLGCL